MTLGERQVTYGTYLTEDEAANAQARWRLIQLLPAVDPEQAVELPGSVSASKTAVNSSAARSCGDIAGGCPSELGPTRCPIWLPDSGGRTVGAILARYAAAPWVGSRDDDCEVFGRSMDGQRASDGSSGV